MKNKIFIFILMVLMSVGIVSADVTCSESVDRDTPTTANGDFQVTYTTLGTSGEWGASIQDSLSGGCTFPSGKTTYRTVMLWTDGPTKTITIIAPSSGTCTFSGGDYMFGTCAIGTFSDDSVSVTQTCQYSNWVPGSCGAGDCVEGERQYTRTVISGQGCTVTTKCEIDVDCTVCTDTTWTPATSTVCSGTSFTQTSNCDNTRTATGTKNCEQPCTDTSWTPLTSTKCEGVTFTQTSNCGRTRTATGTKDCEPECDEDSDCASGETCSDGKCVTPEKCSFFEKKVAGVCEVNTNIIVMGIALIFAYKLFSG